MMSLKMSTGDDSSTSVATSLNLFCDQTHARLGCLGNNHTISHINKLQGMEEKVDEEEEHTVCS